MYGQQAGSRPSCAWSTRIIDWCRWSVHWEEQWFCVNVQSTDLPVGSVGLQDDTRGYKWG